MTIASARLVLAQVAAESLALDDFDVRLGDSALVNHVPQASSLPLLAVQDAGAAETGARDADAAALTAHVAGLHIDYDPALGTPQYIGSPLRLLTDKVAGPIDARQIVAGFVAAHRDLLGIDPAELAAAAMARDFFTDHNGVRHLTYQQQIGGVDIFGAILRTSVTPAGQIINLSSLMLDRPAGGFGVPAGRISAAAAVHAAALNIGIAITQPLTIKQAARGPQERMLFARTADFADDIEVYRLYFPLTGAQIRPAFMVVVPQLGIGNIYETIVDAVDGAVLLRRNRLHFATTEPVTYRVYTSDSPAPGSPGTSTPTGFQFPFVSRNLVTVMPADIMAYSQNGWINDGSNTTDGNNVYAHIDSDGSNTTTEPAITGSAYRVFDFALDTAMAPSTYQSASATQLFYQVNRYHDLLYALGFNEAAGNFQTTNFTGQGAGGDRIVAQAQDAGGTNNANFTTGGADGSTPSRVQMYIFTGPPVDRDGDLDADIVFHELTHGTSIRLHDGTLSAPQGGGMGEGWGDFFGLCINSEPGDDPNAVYCTGGHTTYLLAANYTNNYYFGIRRFPYSTDLTKNPQTYRDIDPAQQFYDGVVQSTVIGNTATEVHNVGEVWCMTLWECRANLIGHYGFSGNNLILQLVLDGMKLSVANPNFLQARDAILQADMVDNGGVNSLPYLWPGFKKRGMGYYATSPGATSTSGIVENFDLPPPLTFSYPLGRPDTAALNGSTQVTVQIGTLFGGMLVPGTVQLHTSVNAAPYVATSMTPGAPNQFVGNLPGAACLSNINWYVSAAEATSGTTWTSPMNAPTSTFTAVSATGTAGFHDDFETNMGWTVGAAGDTATTGVWVRVDPVGTSAQPEDDYNDPGTMCFVTGQHTAGQITGFNDVDGGATTLVSPTFAIANPLDQISYARWFSGSTGDSLVIEISNNNGASWVNVENLTVSAASWTLHAFTVGDLIPPTTQMKMRFRAADTGTGTICEAAIDEFRAIGFLCAVNGNCNGAGGVGLADYATFSGCLTGPGGGPVGPSCTCADFDADTDADLLDAGMFQNAFNGQ